MNYVFSKKVALSFDEAIKKVTEELAKDGFGVLTEIDVTATLKKKLDVNFRPYRILGACNPGYAHQALTKEKWIGAMLPCNVVVQENENGEIEVAAIDPVASMNAVENSELGDVAVKVRSLLEQIISRV